MASGKHVVEPAVDLTEGDGNPLRGLIPFADQKVSTQMWASMEYVNIAMKDVMSGENSFTFEEGLEKHLRAASERDRQLCFRLWVDNPKLETGVPTFLLSGEGKVAFSAYTEHGGGLSPDYTNERLISAMERLILALGRRYNGDNRIGFIYVGLLGFWGEWHTYPHIDWFPPTTIQNRVLEAFANAFPDTRCVVGHAQMSYWDHGDRTQTVVGQRIGFHDDSFPDDTNDKAEKKPWFLCNKLRNHRLADCWQRMPIGGELLPGMQKTMFTSEAGQAQFNEAVACSHASFLIDYHAFKSSVGAAEAEATRRCVRTMGYQYAVTSIEARWRDRTPVLSVALTNHGSAPFYHPLTLDLTTPRGAALVFAQVPAVLPGNTVTIDLCVPQLSEKSSFEGRLSFSSPATRLPIVPCNRGARDSEGALAFTIALPSSAA